MADLKRMLGTLAARQGDSSSVEVKRAADGLPGTAAQTVCAFANMPEGGTLILGVDENCGFQVTGVTDAAHLEAALVSQARSVVHPAPTISAYTLDVDGKQVVIAEVAPLRVSDRPATVGGRAYLRQSDGDYVMHEHELRMLDVDKLHVSEQVVYDREPVAGLTADDLVPELVEQYVDDVRRTNRRLRDHSADDILRLTSVLTASGEPTLAGLYALGDYPQGVYPALTVNAAVQLPRETGVRNSDLRDFMGPIPVMLDELMDWVMLNVPAIHRYRDDGHMERVPELPLSAARELIANALVHRDLGPNTLGVGKVIQVRLTSSALMVQSPGGLRGISLGQLQSESHAQAAVNQRLYAMCKRLTTRDEAPVVEGEGGGLREVFAAAADYSLPRPVLMNTGVQFTALLLRGGDFGAQPDRIVSGRVPSSETPSLTRNGDAIVGFLADGATRDFQAIQHATGLTSGQVRYALTKLVNAGMIQMLGRQGARNTRYRLA